MTLCLLFFFDTGSIPNVNSPCIVRSGNGGGYSGGAARIAPAYSNCGNGGGSYNSGANQINTAGGGEAGNGLVKIWGNLY